MSSKLNSMSIILLIIIIFFGGITISDQLGLWKEDPTEKMAKYDDVDEYKPDEIRGSFSLTEVSELYDVPSELLVEAFGFPIDSNPSAIFGRDFEILFGDYVTEDQEIGNGSIKQFVALYKDLEYTLDETAFFPLNAYDVLTRECDLTDIELEFLKSHLIDTTATLDGTTTEAAVHDEIDELIKGNTTFTQVISTGVSKETIKTALNITIDQENIIIRDFCTNNNLSFSEVKAKLNELILSQ